VGVSKLQSPLYSLIKQNCTRNNFIKLNLFTFLENDHTGFIAILIAIVANAGGLIKIMRHTSFHPFLDLTPPTWLRLAALGSSVQKHFASWSARACDALILSTEPQITQKRDKSGQSYFVIGYQLKAKTPIRSRSQPARVSADLPVHFISPYVGSLVIYDPYDRSRHTFLTEQAVRMWLEKRYSR